MPKPTFSIVLPTCHREKLLARCLESLQPGVQLADAESYELIVTDDARGPTAEAMMRAKFPWARWVKGPSRGPAANRNSGVRHATGEWICFIDDDCIASRQWLAAFLPGLADASTDLMEGPTIVPDQTDNPFLHSVSNPKGGSYWSCNLVIRRDRFLALGGFDEDFLEPAGEDMEFAHRYHANKLGARFYPEAVVYHPVRSVGVRGVLRRHFSIKWSAMYYYKIDEDLHLADAPALNLLRAFKGTIMNHLRTTWFDLRAWRRPLPICRFFWLLLRWVTFPAYLPYYLYWVHKFQKQLNAKAASTAPHPA
jgi:GT2 family glycosyltransferase